MLPILGDDRKDMVFGLLIAMAVSTLTGDALIHLIPMVRQVPSFRAVPRNNRVAMTSHRFPMNRAIFTVYAGQIY